MIEISQDLADRFAVRAKEKGFASTEAYIQWALGEMAKKIVSPSSAATPYNDQEEAMVKDRLRSLGYID